MQRHTVSTTVEILIFLSSYFRQTTKRNASK